MTQTDSTPVPAATSPTNVIEGITKPTSKDFKLSMIFILSVISATVLWLSGWAFRSASGWIGALLVIAVAWPFWAQRAEQNMLSRRSILESISTKDGWLRRTFWSGFLSQSMRLPIAAVGAALLVMGTSQLDATRWTVLLADAFIFFWASSHLRSKLAAQIQPSFLGVVSRGWPVAWLNVILLTALLVATDYFMGFEDTRSMTWLEVAGQAISDGKRGTQSEGIAFLLGLTRLADLMPRHAAMNLLPNVGDLQMRTLAWVAVLSVTTFGAHLYTTYLLGFLSILEKGPSLSLRKTERLRSDWSYMVTAAVLISAFTAMAAKYPAPDWSWMQKHALQLAATMNPCARVTPGFRAAQEASLGSMDAATVAAVAAAMKIVEPNLDAGFKAAAAGVDNYLDEFFSLGGEYKRLWKLANGELTDYMQKRLLHVVIEKTGFKESIEKAGFSANAAVLVEISKQVESTIRNLARTASDQPCMRDSVRPNQLKVSVPEALRAALPVALTTSIFLNVSTRTAALIARKAAGEQTVKTMLKVAGKAAAKRAAGTGAAVITGAAACAPAGPFALLCGAGAALVTWAAVDVGVNVVDEKLFRQKMKDQILKEIESHRNELRRDMQAQLTAIASAYNAKGKTTIKAVFTPATDS